MEVRVTQIKATTGRVYLYPKRSRRLGRKPTVHHPDFSYKAKIKKATPDWSKFNTYQVRAKRLIKHIGKCQHCGIADIRLEVHHKDGNGIHSKSPNHAPENLLVVCTACHQREHSTGFYSRLEQMKSLRKEGLTFHQIGLHLNISRQRVHQLLRKTT